MEFPLFLGMGIIRVLFEEFRSIRSRAHPEETKANTTFKDRSNKFVPRNRSRLKTRKGSQDRDNSAPYLLRSVRECVEKYICNRSTASLLYACHANAYARHVRFPGVTAPSLVVIRVPRLLPALARPRKTKKKEVVLIDYRSSHWIGDITIIFRRAYKYLLGRTYIDTRRYAYIARTSFNTCNYTGIILLGTEPNFIDRRGVGKVLING